MFRGRRAFPPEPPVELFSMTPMIDVVFQLLVFFMLATDLAQRRFDDVLLPPASTAATIGEVGLVVNVLRDGRVRVGGRAVGDRSLQTLFEARRGRGEAVLIRADRSAAFEHVQKIMMIAVHHGNVTRLEFAARKE